MMIFSRYLKCLRERFLSEGPSLLKLQNAAEVGYRKKFETRVWNDFQTCTRVSMTFSTNLSNRLNR